MATAPIFLPVPSYADPILREGADHWRFNPIWLDWFLKLSKGEISGTVSHNALAGLQGGVANQYYHLSAAQLAAMYQANNGAVFAVTLGASPTTVQNTQAYNIDYIVAGGTGVVTDFSRDGATFYNLPAYGMFMLSPGDSLRVAWVTIPTVTGVPR